MIKMTVSGAPATHTLNGSVSYVDDKGVKQKHAASLVLPVSLFVAPVSISVGECLFSFLFSSFLSCSL